VRNGKKAQIKMPAVSHCQEARSGKTRAVQEDRQQHSDHRQDQPDVFGGQEWQECQGVEQDGSRRWVLEAAEDEGVDPIPDGWRVNDLIQVWR